MTPWTLREFLAALRAAGWRRMKGSMGRTYISPDDPEVLFQADGYRSGVGVLWQYYAARRELPSTTRTPS